jgi:hypothetical protein
VTCPIIVSLMESIPETVSVTW